MIEDAIDIGVSENAKVELAKALLAVKSITSREVYEKVRAILVQPEAIEAVDQAVHGLSKEDEFALMCRLMGTTTHLTHLEQRPVLEGDYLVPDFLARFQPGCVVHGKTQSDSNGVRCFVEVKSTSRDSFKIGGKKLQRLRAFADQFGLPLMIAVRFLRFEEHALWVIVEDADRTRNSLKVTYKDICDGVRHVLWDDVMYMVWPSICFRAIYDTTPTDEIGVSHPEYGTQREFHIIVAPDRRIAGPAVVDNEVRFSGVDALTYAAFFEGFRLKEEAVEQRGSVTAQILVPTISCSISDLIYSYNRLPRDENGKAIFDPSRILANTSESTPLIDRRMIDALVNSLGKVVFGAFGFGPPQEQLQKWRRYGGKPDALEGCAEPA